MTSEESPLPDTSSCASEETLPSTRSNETAASLDMSARSESFHERFADTTGTPATSSGTTRESPSPSYPVRYTPGPT